MGNPEMPIEHEPWFDATKELDQRFDVGAGNVEISYKTDDKGNIAEITKLKILHVASTAENDRQMEELIAKIGLEHTEQDASGNGIDAKVFEYSPATVNTTEGLAKIKDALHANRMSPEEAEFFSPS